MKAVGIQPSFIRNLPHQFIFELPSGEQLVVHRRTDMPKKRSFDDITMDVWVGTVKGMPASHSSVTIQVMPSGRLYGNVHFLDERINRNRNFMVRTSYHNMAVVQVAENLGG